MANVPRFASQGIDEPLLLTATTSYQYSVSAVRLESVYEVAAEAAVPIEAEADLPEDQSPELPHWTYPPTGAVPKVLSRDSGNTDEDLGAWSNLPAPTWREENADWEVHEEEFEPAMLAHEEAPLGSLDEWGPSDRQPWEFDLPGADAPVVDREGDPLVDFDDELDADLDKGPWARSEAGDPGGTSVRADLPGRSEIETPSLFSTGPVAIGGASTEPTPALVDLPCASAGDTPDVDAGDAGRTEQVVAVSAEVAAGSPQPRPGPVGRRRSAAPVRRIGGGLSRFQPDGRFSGTGDGDSEGPRGSVAVRVATALPVAVVAIVAFLWGPVPILVVAVIVVTMAAAECFSALRRAGRHPATLLGLVGTVALLVGVYQRGETALVAVVALAVVFTLLWFLFGVERGADPVTGTAATLFGFGWIAVLGSFAALLLDPRLFPDRHGEAYLFGAVLATVAADVGALVFGMWLGRHPVARSVSPRKTWEGVVGGGVVAVLVSFLWTGSIHPWTPARAALLGLVVAVLAPIGDLCESMVKRDLGVKDMGSLLPGHGGVLDRVDALLFVLPATYYLVRAFHMG